MSSQFSASEHLVGYLYQVRYALLILLQKIKDEPEIELSLERLDDVAFERDGEAIELLQTKHHINQSAQLTDSSSDLWKTLRVWSTHILENPSRSDDLVLLLITTSNASVNSLSSKLRRDDRRNEDYALQKLVDIAKTTTNKANKPAYDAFSSLSDTQKKALINKIIIVDNSPNIQDVDDKLLRETRLLSRHPSSLKVRLEGWWFKRAIDHLMADDDSSIKGAELQSKIYDLQDELSKESLPNDFPTGVMEMGEESLSEKERIFVEQLRLILLKNTRLRIAIGDYYRAFQQRTKWLSEGLLYPRELEDYEDYLIGEWRRQFERMKEDIEELPGEDKMAQLGKALFERTEDNNFRPIRPGYFDAYFSRGSYHVLANNLRIGWHPEFTERLGHLIEQAASQVS
jgi:hypothetical protein